MPGMKALLIAVVGPSGAIESYLSPPAAAKLAQGSDRESLFVAFAAEVEQAAKPLKTKAVASQQLRLAWFREVDDAA